MTKSELCEAAGVSPSTIDRDVRAGLLKPEYVKNGTGPAVAHYNDKEAERYIEYRQGKIKPTEALQVARKQDIATQSDLMKEFLDKLGEKITESMKATNGQQFQRRLVYNLKQAAQYTGITSYRLKQLCKSGELKGFINDMRVGRGYRFRELDLDRYVTGIGKEK